jgi:hypothetical protein
MTEEERYLFDLRGYVVVPGAIDPETLDRMNRWIDDQASEDPKWNGQRENSHLDHLLTWTADFRNLLDNPVVLPYLKELMGDQLRLDHDYAIFLQPGGGGLGLHCGAVPYDPGQYYHCFQGRIYSGLTVAVYSLTNVPPGAGGFCCIPGSHRNNFECPVSLRQLDPPSEALVQIPARAGDCVVFSEALTHGTIPWRGPGVRRTLYYKYSPCHSSWSNTAYFPMKSDPTVPEFEHLLTERQRILLDPPGIFQHRTVE